MIPRTRILRLGKGNDTNLPRMTDHLVRIVHHVCRYGNEESGSKTRAVSHQMPTEENSPSKERKEPLPRG